MMIGMSGLTVCVRRHRRSCDDGAGDTADSASGSGSGLSPTTATAGRVYASPTHLRSVCPSSHHHVHCADKYDTAAAYWFETSLRPETAAAANQLCWNQTVKFLPPPSLDDLLTPHDPYAVADRNWTAVSGAVDPVTAVSL